MCSFKLRMIVVEGNMINRKVFRLVNAYEDSLYRCFV